MSRFESDEELQNYITTLSNEWYTLVNKDHHKDRDCHFYINTIWSYGGTPYYHPEHYGYVVDSSMWDNEFPRLTTLGYMPYPRGFLIYNDAMLWLRDKLIRMIAEETGRQKERD